jgi:hypothetical protein
MAYCQENSEGISATRPEHPAGNAIALKGMVLQGGEQGRRGKKGEQQDEHKAL